VPGSSASNNNGRSLEYLISDALNKVSGCTFTSRAAEDQIRDSATVKLIDPLLRKSFKAAADLVQPWILSEIEYSKGSQFQVDRHSDSDQGVADITLKRGASTLAISVKHNHDALSHPRPYSLADAMGLAGTHLEVDHRNRMSKITDNFRKASRGATTFPEVPTLKLKLYQAACSECATTVNLAARKTGVAGVLFDFLVGSNFKKLLVETSNSNKSLKSITVADYTNIKSPGAVKATVDNRSRASSLILIFDNGWKIDLRIKNASTGISQAGQVSLKFDAQKKAGAIPPIQVIV